MKLALLTDGIYPYIIGGMQKHSYYLAKYLSAKGVQIDLYHCSSKKNIINSISDFFSPSELNNIQFIEIDFPDSGKLPGHYLRASKKYSEHIFNEFQKRSNVDFIYAKGFTGWHFIIQKQKGAKLAPVGINFHGYEMFQRLPDFRERLKSLLFRSTVRYLSNKADFVFSYGAKITDIIKSIGVNQNKIIELPSGIENKWINSQPLYSNKVLKFVFVGRYERRKGIEEIHKVLYEIINLEELHFEFNFIGPIPENKKLYDKKIKYWGIVKEQEAIQKIISKCDILVCPSYSEGMPNVIIEGMAAGLAVIATNVGAINLLVNKETGWLIETCNVNDLKEVMFDAIRVNADLLLNKKQAALKLIEKNFIWDKIAEDTISIITKAIAATD